MKWIKVKDELPTIEEGKYKAHREILAFDGERVWNANFRYMYDNKEGKGTKIPVFNTFCKQCCGGEMIKNVTHWMYFPKFPYEKSRE